MSSFDVQLSNRAEKQLKSLSGWRRRAVMEALLEMEIDPFAGDHRKLTGCDSHRRRIGKYRILYDVDTDLRLVTVFGIRHRKDAYRE